MKKKFKKKKKKKFLRIRFWPNLDPGLYTPNDGRYILNTIKQKF